MNLVWYFIVLIVDSKTSVAYSLDVFPNLVQRMCITVEVYIPLWPG